jgi:hypothetical protein
LNLDVVCCEGSILLGIIPNKILQTLRISKPSNMLEIEISTKNMNSKIISFA